MDNDKLARVGPNGNERTIDHLLFCLGEECGELQQIVGKAGRFGVYSESRKTKERNVVSLKKEYHDIVAMYQLLMFQLGEDTRLEPELIRYKKDKTIAYFNNES